jgi:DEAD/DEAH box helicase domain-containing protein
VRGRQLLDRVLAGVPADESPLTHAADLPAQPGRHTDWPDWAPAEVIDRFVSCGVDRPWTHQVEAAEAARAGRNVVLSTGTGSGKSLAYQLPVLATLAEHRKATALYLAPTKALGADQLRSLAEIDLPGLRAAAFDGDTPMAERDWVRAHGRWVFSNPDMLHRGILPAHARWARFFRNLAFVVIDECHAYRGVFGSHVALLLRRLRRVAAHYGASPVFVLASATAADPAGSATRLTGVPCQAVTEDGSPRGARTVALWEPPLLPELTGENGSPVRRSAGAEASRIMADLVLEGARTLTFVRSRRGAELAALGARRILDEVAGELAGRVAAYRGGFLPEERRALERALDSGELLGVASTNALELGVDISGLDAVVVAGYPGTLASFWQQAGRAGRAAADALVVFVAREDPLDTYLVHHPAAVLHRPVEATVFDPANAYVLTPQLACAAAELPLREADLADFGGPAAHAALDELVADGVVRRRPTGWYWTARERPQSSVDIRGSGGEQVAVVEADSARFLGTVDPGSACWSVHPGALYLHQGKSYVVDELDLEGGIALVHAEDPEWSTMPRDVVDISVVNTVVEKDFGGVRTCLGEVEVTSQVIGYLRRLPSGQIIDQVPLDLPAQTLRTRAVWYTVSDGLLRDQREPDDSKENGRGANGDGANGRGMAGSGRGLAVPGRGAAGSGRGAGSGRAAEEGGPGPGNPAHGAEKSTQRAEPGSGDEGSGDEMWCSAPGGAGLDPARIPGALHAAEHAAIGLLPLFATCDRWDIGGVSTALHEDTGEATVFVHDGHPGGAGFADRGFAALVPWLAATREAISACECPTGCPSCVQSPKCGNGNEPLDKAGAVAVLDVVLREISGSQHVQPGPVDDQAAASR